MSAISGTSIPNTPQNHAEDVQNTPQKNTDKEYNFAQIRQQLEREKQEKLQMKEEIEKLKKIAQEKLSSHASDDDDDDEPYIDKKKLKKELNKVVEQTNTETDSKIQSIVNKALSEERQKHWLQNNPDFQDVMQHAQKLQDSDPELADIILNMPENFERHKLVYKHIKATGLHKPAQSKSNIQEKIDANRRSPYYQPSGIATPGYGIVNGGKDYNDTEMKSAYDIMQQSKKRMRI
jgi:hypothetical protein